MSSSNPPSQVRARVADTASVDLAIESRFSARAFLPTPVARETIEDILRVASRAPSGTNTQPWQAYVLLDGARDRVVQAVSDAHAAGVQDAAVAATYRADYAYYPTEWVSPYIDRRRENGWGLYGLLGITKGDKARMYDQHHRNFCFFDAPVGLMFTIDRVLGLGSMLDFGMFLQSVMVAARARGLHTCPQAAWNDYGRIIMPIIGAPDTQMLVCGMALGHADEAALVNRFHTPRVDVQSFARWVE